MNKRSIRRKRDEGREEWEMAGAIGTKENDKTERGKVDEARGGGFFKKICTGMLKVDFRSLTFSIPQKA